MRVMTQFPLLNEAVFLRMGVLDRIFNRDDMPPTLRVDLIDHGRQRGRFAMSCGSGDQDKTLNLFREPHNRFRHTQFLQTAYAFRDDTESYSVPPQSGKHIDSKIGDIRYSVTEIQLPLFLEPFGLIFIQNLAYDIFEVFFGKDFTFNPLKLTIDSYDGRITFGQMNILLYGATLW